ncbi:MAG TPA: 50S ribosomal protein L20 [Planctomycetes bacterium]|nr:50S ribosomal protein L20 [Planctomycetota bacterium]
MRVRCRPASRARRRRILKAAKGYVGGRRRLLRTASEAVIRARAEAYKGRKLKKRDFRRLWITRITAAARNAGMSYSHFIGGLKKAGVELNRKQISEIAIHDPSAFLALVEKAKSGFQVKA